MATVPVPGSLKAEEFSRLDEVEGYRDELIEGERVLSPSPILPHGAVVERLWLVLRGKLPEISHEPLRVVMESGWKFRNPASGLDSVPTPDLMIVREADYRKALKQRGWFEGTPLMVIEVISPSERKSRRLQKLGLYQEMGVPHILEADYTKREIQIHTPDLLRAAVYHAGDRMTSPFTADIDEIFAVLDQDE